MKFLNVVLFAENYEKLISWYRSTFELDILYQEKGAYNYTELGKHSKVIVGITPASEVEHIPTSPKNNSAILQLEVSDINLVCDRVLSNKGKVLFGPSYEEKHGFFYGGMEDLEGNQIWFVENPEQSMIS